MFKSAIKFLIKDSAIYGIAGAVNKIIAVLSEEKSQKIKELQASGKVVFFKDKQLATGDKATYYLNQDKVIITGNVELKKDGNIIKGEKLVIK